MNVYMYYLLLVYMYYAPDTDTTRISLESLLAHENVNTSCELKFWQSSGRLHIGIGVCVRAARALEHGECQQNNELAELFAPKNNAA